MARRGFLKKTGKLEIQEYKVPRDLRSLRASHVPYSGSPRKHPQDPEKVILVADPYSYDTNYYEFRINDVSYVEKLPSLVNLEGETIPMARIWVKKKSLGVLCSPFIVEETSGA